METTIIINGDCDVDEIRKNHGILIFYVNGKKVTDSSPDPEQTLLTYLRDKLRLCGTKLGCGEGGCGACTVMVSKIDRRVNTVKHFAVNACLTPVCSVHGMAITTIEGIGSTRTKLHPVQERIAKAHGSQCGFCTPGIVMSMYALLRNLSKPTMKDMEIAFQGNLCRCTGYRSIIEGYRTFTQEYECAMGDKCCKNGGTPCESDTAETLFERSEFMPLDPTQEPIFPSELKISDFLERDLLIFQTPRVTWYRPKDLKQLLRIKNSHPDVKIVVGNTEVGVEVKFKHFHYPILAYPGLVNELTEIIDNGTGLHIGSAVTLMEIEDVMRDQIKKLPEHETRLFKAIVDMLQYFAGKQIRNVASVGGNIMTGSPISDLNPIFMAAGIELEVQSLDRGSRKLKFDENFFTGYRKNILKSDELLVSIYVPRSKRTEFFLAYKQAKRRDDDIAIVNAAFKVKFKSETNDIIEDLRIAYGGMAPTTVLAVKSASKVIGMSWNNEMLERINRELIDELPLSSGAPGGMILYRRSLTLSLFFKGFLEISQILEKTVIGRIPIPINERSGADLFHTLPPKSAQLFEKTPDNQPPMDPIGRPKVHNSAFKQATGEAVYCDDMPHGENELYLAFVLSTKAHATINSIDATEALNQSGVHAFYSAKELSDDCNKTGPVFRDEEYFITKTVTSQGQVLGAIVADNQAIAQRAARLVKIDYTELTPIIISIEDAIEKNSFFTEFPKEIIKGNIENAFIEADHVFDGECRLGGQEHFYLETQACIAVPRDMDELEVVCSTQNPAEVQKMIADVLQIPFSKVVVRVKRMGGGFGGKQSRSNVVAIPVALAAYRLGRPVRCMLDRDEDMMITGTRHPFLCRYKVGCMKDGRIVGCDIKIYSNAGYSLDLSVSVLERAMFHFQNSYFIPNIRVYGRCCRTNLTSNTAFRGFGGPQGMFAGEHIIRDVAHTIGKDLVEVAELNMYKVGDVTHYNQEIQESNMQRCWKEVIESSNYFKRKIETEKFNENNRWRKRGITLVPTKYGVAFTELFLNQTAALIHIYADGSVLISHGGTEMGQGLHIKMIQVASRVLNIPTERIHISETSTDKVPNTSPTAASVGSDLNGMAVLNACNTLLERIKPYKEKYPEESWNAWINKAYFDRVSLSTTEFYATPNIGYDPETNSGEAFNYYCNGAACSEVEVDCLTGDHQVIRTDIVMDVGSSLNPAIDIGQIEGGFMQGYGLFTLEEMIYSPTGTLYSRGPGMYKLPGFSDIPGEFNVSILTGAPNPRAVYSSKAIGEPPLFLASSVFFAIKEAIKAARKDANLTRDFILHSPATSSRIRMACSDQFTEKIDDAPIEAQSTPWNLIP